MYLLLTALLSPLFSLPIWFIVQCGKKAAKPAPAVPSSIGQPASAATATQAKKSTEVATAVSLAKPSALKTCKGKSTMKKGGGTSLLEGRKDEKGDEQEENDYENLNADQ